MLLIMKILICLRGTSGSGKTTLAKCLDTLLFGRIAIFAADDFFTRYNGEYNFDPKLLGEAHKSCQKNAEYAASKGTQVIVVHNTSTTEKELAPYREIADKYGYQFFSVIVENRHGGKDVHNVPQNVRENQAKKLAGSIKLI